MIEKDGRCIEELPKNFTASKKEFDKMFNFMIAKIKEKCKDDKKSELEEYGVMFALIQEFHLFIDKYEEQISVHMKDLMDDLNKYKVFLARYGKKIEFDKNASWFYIDDLSKSDWLEFDKKSNEEFLKKRNQNKILNGEI